MLIINVKLKHFSTKLPGSVFAKMTLLGNQKSTLISNRDVKWTNNKKVELYEIDSIPRVTT